VTEGAVDGADAGGDAAPTEDREPTAEPAAGHDESPGRDAGAGTPPTADREDQ
jgi:hypothetical protein